MRTAPPAETAPPAAAPSWAIGDVTVHRIDEIPLPPETGPWLLRPPPPTSSPNRAGSGPTSRIATGSCASTATASPWSWTDCAYSSTPESATGRRARTRHGTTSAPTTSHASRRRGSPGVRRPGGADPSAHRSRRLEHAGSRRCLGADVPQRPLPHGEGGVRLLGRVRHGGGAARHVPRLRASGRGGGSARPGRRAVRGHRHRRRSAPGRRPRGTLLATSPSR